MNPNGYYQLAPGVDVVPLREDAVLFRSNTLAVKIEGSMATLLGKHVLPLLSHPRALGELAKHGELAPDELATSLQALVKAHVLKHTEELPAPRSDLPFAAFLESLGSDPVRARECLKASTVGIFGLEAQGAHLALELARLGLGGCLLADPFPVEESDALLMPAAAYRPGRTRQEAVKEALGDISPDMNVTLAGELSRDAVGELVEPCAFLVGCFDRGYETAQHWLNRAAIAAGKPVLFSEIRTHVAMMGPCVYPRQTSCYMCYRMRRVASEENYDEAMAYERFANGRNHPSLSARATAPFLPAHIASVLAGEVLKHVVLGLPSALAGQVLMFDALTLDSRFHKVLQQPDCPVCWDGEDKAPRVNPTLLDLGSMERNDPTGDLGRLTGELVSPVTGVVRRFEPFLKDPGEPAIPYIVRADLSNHRFIPDREDAGDVCSGKGMTLSDARVSALGEAVERYSGAVYSANEIHHARRSEAIEESLDPRALVLYDEAQYVDLPYARYDDNRLGWVPARSLVSGREVRVPALAVFMNYHAHGEELLFPITSNGLAAGRTLSDAIWRATCEVLERDAFMVAWLNRLPARRYSARSHPEPGIRELSESYVRRGVELRLYRMPSDHEVAVFAGMALEAHDAGGPAVTVGLGVDRDPVTAAARAVLEVCQVRPALRRRLRQPQAAERLRELLGDPRRVATIDDHDLLYASPEALPRLGFWLDSAEEPFPYEPVPAASPSEHLHWFVDWLASTGHDLLYVNLTPPDMARLGIYTARAILPEFQPIDFGWRERRLGGSRVRRLPVEIGLRREEPRWNDLNHDPHPLA